MLRSSHFVPQLGNKARALARSVMNVRRERVEIKFWRDPLHWRSATAAECSWNSGLVYA